MNEFRNHRGLVSLVCFLALAGTAPTGLAQSTYFTETTKTVARLGVQGVQYYVGFAEPLTQSCLYGNVYVAPDRKSLYVQLLAAKLSNKRLSRVDYSQPAGSGTQCNAELIE